MMNYGRSVQVSEWGSYSSASSNRCSHVVRTYSQSHLLLRVVQALELDYPVADSGIRDLQSILLGRRGQ